MCGQFIASLIHINNCVKKWLHSQFLSTIMWKSPCISNSNQQLFSRNLYLICTLSVVGTIANNFFYVLICKTQELEDFYFKILSKDARIYLRVVSTFYNRFFEKGLVQNVNFVYYLKSYCIILIQYSS